jgi:hypothetical protein
VAKNFQGIPWWAFALAGLCAVTLGWLTWNWARPRPVCAMPASITGEPFLIMGDHQSNVDAISVRRGKTWQPVWAEWDFNFDRQPDTTSYFHAGRPVLNVNRKAGQPEQFEFYSYGAGRSYVRWVGGNGIFTERFFYDEQERLTRHEVLRGQTWQPARE